jgi:hypothetical protein
MKKLATSNALLIAILFNAYAGQDDTVQTLRDKNANAQVKHATLAALAGGAAFILAGSLAYKTYSAIKNNSLTDEDARFIARIITISTGLTATTASSLAGAFLFNFAKNEWNAAHKQQ